MTESSYRSPWQTARRALVTTTLGAAIAVSGALTALASGGTFDGGGQIDDTYTYADGPHAVAYDDTLYLYGTGTDGNAYYVTYDGQSWDEAAGWDDQVAEYQGKPTAVEFAGKQYIFYSGQDNGLYHNGYDGQSWDGWEDLAGEYEFPYAPYANVWQDTLFLYGVADDGNLYAKSYGEDAAWSDWAPVNDDYAAGAYQPYSVAWDGHENVLWTGDDGKVYWNRYDGTEWTGARELAGDGEYGYAPYAVGYQPEEQLYAYAVSTDGIPYYNVFAEGDGWSGWATYGEEPPAQVKHQPNAYVYDDIKHNVYTGDNGHAYYISYDGTWGEWQDLGPTYDYDPYTFEYGGNYYLTYTGENGYLYYKVYAAGVEDEDDTDY